MIRWTGLAPWKFEFPFPGSLTSTFLAPVIPLITDERRFLPDMGEDALDFLQELSASEPVEQEEEEEEDSGEPAPGPVKTVRYPPPWRQLRGDSMVV